MTIRLLNEDDTLLFRALRIAAIHDSPGSFGESTAEITTRSLADFSGQLQSHGRGDFVLGAFNAAAQLTGMVGFYRAIPEKLAHKGTLWGMYVSPTNRQQGIGRALVAAAIDRVQNLSKILSVTLCVTASNHAARRLYESQGFQVYGIEQKAINIDGVYFDEILMQLIIPGAAAHAMGRPDGAAELNQPF